MENKLFTRQELVTRYGTETHRSLTADFTVQLFEKYRRDPDGKVALLVTMVTTVHDGYGGGEHTISTHTMYPTTTAKKTN